MKYVDLIAKILETHTVYRLSKMWGVNQPRLHRYISGETLPDFDTAWKMAEVAGVSPEVAFKSLAEEERNHKAKSFKLQKGFVQTEALAIVAATNVVAILSILC